MKTAIVGVIMIAGFGALGAGAFKKTVTPYVSVPEARAARDVVQVYGEVDQKKLRFDMDASEIRFPLKDLQGNTMMVHYRGVRPGNMAQASHCVATGAWEGNHFQATALLIKCPSKYQGEESAGTA